MPPFGSSPNTFLDPQDQAQSPHLQSPSTPTPLRAAMPDTGSQLTLGNGICFLQDAQLLAGRKCCVRTTNGQVTHSSHCHTTAPASLHQAPCAPCCLEVPQPNLPLPSPPRDFALFPSFPAHKPSNATSARTLEVSCVEPTSLSSRVFLQQHPALALMPARLLRCGWSRFSS